MQLDDDARPHRLPRPSSTLTVDVVSLHDEPAPYTLDRHLPLRHLANAVFASEPFKLRPHLGLVYARGRSPFTPTSVLDQQTLDEVTVGDFVGRRAIGFQFFVVALVTVVGLGDEPAVPVVVTGYTLVREVRDEVATAWGLGDGQGHSVQLYVDGLGTQEMPDPSLCFTWSWAVDGQGGCVYARVGKCVARDVRWPFGVTLLNGMKGTTGRNVELEVTGQTTTLELKQRIRAEHGIPINHQRVVYQGEEMADSQTLSFYEVTDGATLHLRCHCP